MLAIAANGLSLVVFGAVAFSVVMSLVFLFMRGQESLYNQIGSGGLSRDGEAGAGPPAPAPDSPAARAEREQEVRQMLTARSERLVRRGEPALDIDAEVARLLAPMPAAAGGGHEAGLVEEVRQLAIARNERRARQGLEPLDVDSEVARTLAELDP